MADGPSTRELQRDAQQAASVDQAFAEQIEGRLKNLHTCLPGIIVNFDGVTQTATVQPAIQRIFTEKGPVNLPVCVDVPVLFPGGGGFALTFPVTAGDECLLMFSERAIDLWFTFGQTQPPSEYRLHDLSDGVALVGLNSQPNVLTDYHPTNVELRNRARTVRLSLYPDGTIELVNALASMALAPNGLTTITSSLGITINADVTVNGTLTATTDVIGGGKSLKTHVHSGVQGGVGNSGPPV